MICIKHTIAFHIINLSRRIRKYIDLERLCSNLSYTQASAILVIDSWEKISQTEIATYLQLEPATLVTLIDDLEDLKLVQRKVSADRRKYQIVLTGKGQKLAEEIKSATWKLDDFLKGSLTQDEVLVFDNIIEKLNHVLGANGKEVKNAVPRSEQYLAN